MDYARGWPGAAPQDQCLPGHTRSQRAGDQCTALQLSSCHTTLEFYQIRVRDASNDQTELNQDLFSKQEGVKERERERVRQGRGGVVIFVHVYKYYLLGYVCVVSMCIVRLSS